MKTQTNSFKSVTAAVVMAIAGVSALALSAALLSAPAAHAQAAAKATVDAAKAQGIVGETATGFLAFVKASSDASVKAAVDEINAGRRDVYAQAAAKNGVSVEAAGGSAFTNIIFPKMPAGEFYQDASGVWKQK